MWLMPHDIGAPDERKSNANASAAKHWEGIRTEVPTAVRLEVCRAVWQWGIDRRRRLPRRRQRKIARGDPETSCSNRFPREAKTATRQIGFKWIDNVASPR